MINSSVTSQKSGSVTLLPKTDRTRPPSRVSFTSSGVRSQPYFHERSCSPSLEVQPTPCTEASLRGSHSPPVRRQPTFSARNSVRRFSTPTRLLYHVKSDMDEGTERRRVMATKRALATRSPCGSPWRLASFEPRRVSARVASAAPIDLSNSHASGLICRTERTNLMSRCV
jgi:hypothetical protein